MLTYILFIIGFVLLIKGAGLLVDGSSSLAKKLKISNIVIGLTIVAFGTSSPELVVNLIASIKGTTEIAIGNILGSNIANVFLILGISAIIYPLITKKNTIQKEIPLSLLAAILLGIMANDAFIDHNNFSVLSRIDGLVFITFFIIFIYYTFGIAKVVDGEFEETKIKIYNNTVSTFMIIGGLIALFFGGKWIVDGAVKIAESFGVSQSLIGLTIVAVGTSLPELATSAVAAYKKRCDIAIGNIVGSNIFNIFFILGISATIKPLPFSGHNTIDVFVVIFSNIALLLTMVTGRKRVIERWEGIVFILIYLTYISWLIWQG